MLVQFVALKVCFSDFVRTFIKVPDHHFFPLWLAWRTDRKRTSMVIDIIWLSKLKAVSWTILFLIAENHWQSGRLILNYKTYGLRCLI